MGASETTIALQMDEFQKMSQEWKDTKRKQKNANQGQGEKEWSQQDVDNFKMGASWLHRKTASLWFGGLSALGLGIVGYKNTIKYFADTPPKFMVKFPALRLLIVPATVGSVSLISSASAYIFVPYAVESAWNKALPLKITPNSTTGNSTSVNPSTTTTK